MTGAFYSVSTLLTQMVLLCYKVRTFTPTLRPAAGTSQGLLGYSVLVLSLSLSQWRCLSWSCDQFRLPEKTETGFDGLKPENKEPSDGPKPTFSLH